jgi:hypothetical protein
VTSERQLRRRLGLLLDSVEEVDAFRMNPNPAKARPPDATALLEALDGFLDSAFEHTEDCLGILQSFFPPSAKFMKDRRVRKYHNAVDPYRNFLANRVNYLKHRQGRLRMVRAQTQNAHCDGYFFEGVYAEPHAKMKFFSKQTSRVGKGGRLVTIRTLLPPALYY